MSYAKRLLTAEARRCRIIQRICAVHGDPVCGVRWTDGVTVTREHLSDAAIRDGNTPAEVMAILNQVLALFGGELPPGAYLGELDETTDEL